MEPVIPNVRQAAFAVAALVLALSADVSVQGERAEATTPIANTDVFFEKER